MEPFEALQCKEKLEKLQQGVLNLQFRVDKERAAQRHSRRMHYQTLESHRRDGGTPPTLEEYGKAQWSPRCIIKEQCGVICEFAPREDWHCFPRYFVLALRYFPELLSTIMENCTPEEFQRIFDGMVENDFFQLLNANVLQFNLPAWRRVISSMPGETLLLRADPAGMNMIESLAKSGGNFEALVHLLIRHISFVFSTLTLVNKGFHDIAWNRNLASYFSFMHLPTDVCKHIGKQCVAPVGIGGNLRAVLEGMQDTSGSARKILVAMNSADDLSAYYTLLKAMEL